MSAMKNMKENISPKSRLMIILAVAAVSGIVGLSIYRLSGSGSPTSSGSASIDTAPSTREIARDKPTDEIIFSPDSQIGQLYEKDEKERADTAIKEGDTHVDQFRLTDFEESERRRIKEEEEKKAPAVPVQNRLDELIAERRRIESEQQQKAQVRQTEQTQARMQENPWKIFLDNEKSLVSSSLTSKLDEIGKTPSIPRPSIEINSKESKTVVEEGRRQPVSASDDNDEANQRISLALQRLGGRPASTTVAVEKEAAEYPSERISLQITDKEVPKGKILVGDTFMAVLQVGVNTDEISEVKATIVEKGPLEGATLVGMPRRVGEKAHIQFSNMSAKREGYGISAVALDPDTHRSLLADGVDKHTFSRVMSLGAASFIEGYADAMTTTQTVTSPEGNSTTTRDGLPDSSDQVKYAVGNVGKKFTPIMERGFDRPPTVTVESNKIIYIMFTSEVDLEVK